MLAQSEYTVKHSTLEPALRDIEVETSRHMMRCDVVLVLKQLCSNSSTCNVQL
jgi:hypothetical protein